MPEAREPVPNPLLEALQEEAARGWRQYLPPPPERLPDSPVRRTLTQSYLQLLMDSQLILEQGPIEVREIARDERAIQYEFHMPIRIRRADELP